MSARDILLKAIEFDKVGRYLEACHLYIDGTQKLCDSINNENDITKKQHYKTKIEEYLKRAEEIKTFMKAKSMKGEVIDRICIMEGATGRSYKNVFGKYLTMEITEMEISEPYIKEHYQNLIIFFELCVKKCRNLKFIKLATKSDPNNTFAQKKNLDDIKNSLKSKAITLVIEFSDSLHDREIILNNDVIIRIGRGLHYFKAPNPKYSIGMCDFDFRECFQTTIDIYKCVK